MGSSGQPAEPEAEVKVAAPRGGSLESVPDALGCGVAQETRAGPVEGLGLVAPSHAGSQPEAEAHTLKGTERSVTRMRA